jgi:hypothetical protein
MAKRKMLVWMREKLEAHAGRVVEPAKEKKALDAAYVKAQVLVRKAVEAKYPPSEMRVLKKHQCSEVDTEVRVQFPNGVVQQFVFSNEDAPLIPNHYEAKRRIYLVDATTATAVEKWVDARDAHKAERKRRLDAYKALIQGASYVEDIVSVWPEVAAVIPAQSLPIALGPEQIAVVKQDLRERKAA